MGLDTWGFIRMDSPSLSFPLPKRERTFKVPILVPQPAGSLPHSCGGLLLGSLPLTLSLSAGKIIIRLLHDDYPTVRGCNTRNKRAVSWCGGSDDKPNKSAAHLAPLGETHVRTSVFGNEPVFSKSSPTIRVHTRVYVPCRRHILKGIKNKEKCSVRLF